MTTLTTAQRYSESATSLSGIVAHPNETLEATSYLTDAVSRLFSRLQGTISGMTQTRTADEAFSIEGLYSLKGKAAVIQFLDEYPFLIPLLLVEARKNIRAHFPHSKVSLEVIVDPEAEDDQLLASVSTTLDADDAYRRLKEFDRAWWLDAMEQSQGLLCISVKLQ